MNLRGLIGLIWVFVAGISVIACSSFGNGPDSANSLVIAAPVAHGAINAITEAAGSAQLGLSTPIVDPLTGESVTIRVLRRYDSGAGNSCANYAITGKNNVERTGIVCNIGGTWQEMRPLLLSSWAQQAITSAS